MSVQVEKYKQMLDRLEQQTRADFDVLKAVREELREQCKLLNDELAFVRAELSREKTKVSVIF